MYFAGDTAFFSGIASVWPERLDLALLPIAGIGPWMPELKHMSPRHAIRAMELLRPRLVVPIDWGTYHLPGTAILPPGPRFSPAGPILFMAQAAAREPDVHTMLMRPGNVLSLEETSMGTPAMPSTGAPAPQAPAGPAELSGPGVPGGVPCGPRRPRRDRFRVEPRAGRMA